ncbi:MAG: tryptophan 2,3-dioxygenase [Planctomycetota bacterium]
MALSYGEYLKIDDLLELQVPRSEPPEHDEQIFIITHQTYELWFKLLLHEFEKVKADFGSNELFGAIHTMKRVRMIMKTLVGQIDILETMSPMTFTSFRDRLETASGFQSVQYRELEFLLGYRRPELLEHHPQGSVAREILTRRLAEPSVVDCFYEFLAERGVKVPRRLRERPPAEANRPDREIQKGILRLYRSAPEVALLFELMVDFDEGFQEWRYRHVKMVERTIGSKQGTGGSLGVPFLKESLFRSLFPDLWAIRHEL